MFRVSNSTPSPTSFKARRGSASHKELRQARKAEARANESSDARVLGQFPTDSLEAKKEAPHCQRPTFVDVSLPVLSRSASVVSDASSRVSSAASSAMHTALAHIRRFFTATVTAISNVLNRIVSFFGGFIHNARPSVASEKALRKELNAELERMASIEDAGGYAPDAHVAAGKPAASAVRRKKKKVPAAPAAPKSTGPKPVDIPAVKPGKSYASALATPTYADVARRAL